MEYVLFHNEQGVWPSFSKGSKFWQQAAEFIQERSKASAKRTDKIENALVAMHDNVDPTDF